MASVIDIVNLALGRLGDTANVTSIDPPEGSVQSQLAARFYPIARDTLLERAYWGFATKRCILTLLSVSPDEEYVAGNEIVPVYIPSARTEWRFMYAVPRDMMSALAVMPPDAKSDYSYNAGFHSEEFRGIGGAPYVPKDYSIELNDEGIKVIYSNQALANLRYTAFITNTSLFTPAFTDALAWLLASYLAGPVIKGSTGIEMAKSCLQAYNLMLNQAITADAMQRQNHVEANVNWISGR